MNSYCIRYRLASRVKETRELFVEAPDAKAAAERARQVLGANHRIEEVYRLRFINLNHPPGDPLRQRRGRIEPPAR